MLGYLADRGQIVNMIEVCSGLWDELLDAPYERDWFRFLRIELRRLRSALALLGPLLPVERSDDVAGFWKVLNETLQCCHGVKPVHSVAELELLMSRFPENIKLYVARLDDELLAGSVVFDCGKVVHTQYLAASPKGKQMGALDLVINYLIAEVYADREYLDFGISTEQGGMVLNEGLAFQKEMFGGRGVNYDCWKVSLIKG